MIPPDPADQTPTPTRFLRNCEETGLFQELETNPFEQVSVVYRYPQLDTGARDPQDFKQATRTDSNKNNEEQPLSVDQVLKL